MMSPKFGKPIGEVQGGTDSSVSVWPQCNNSKNVAPNCSPLKTIPEPLNSEILKLLNTAMNYK
jgi:hypothetical protein